MIVAGPVPTYAADELVVVLVAELELVVAAVCSGQCTAAGRESGEGEQRKRRDRQETALRWGTAGWSCSCS
jgi:hypothetical protein